ncbi:Sucrose permease 9-like protein [Cladobotryum mycophilum]|uniref:Sucrose permease 9-like protein n=1 Tax=Cladobotryum mycophilum TaxID=491253 RepID=A0ABR0SZK7_9HYPO
MDLNGDTDDDDLDQAWGEPEPDIQISKSPFPPTRSLGFLFLLAAGIGGLQGVFALIFSNGSAHLRDLGLSKPAQALVWITGPLAGMTVQPYCGILSDQCRSPWGRRRPFIASGAVAIITSLLGLASAERLSAVLVRLWAGSGSFTDAHFQEEPVKAVAAYITVFFIVSLNIALQPLQGGLRALIADMCPRTQQPTATAVAGGVVCASNILSYAVGFVDLRQIPVLRALGGDSQFAMLCILTSGTLAVSVGLTCLSVRERSAALDDEDELYTHSAAARGSTYTVRAQLWYLCTSFLRLPRQVQQVFKVQFFSWMGWFPFLFYATTYISETYKNDLNAVQRPNKDIQARAARMGSLGLMLFALVALVAVALVSIAHQHANRGRQTTVNIGAFTRLTRSIRCMWITSQVLFAICMLATAFESSLTGVYILVGVSGISWAVTIWAPYALISAQVVHSTGRGGNTIYSEPLMQYDEYLLEEDDPHQLMELDKAGDDNNDHREGVDDACERRPGIILGLHNVAIAGPQIVAAASCSLIFWMLEGSSQDSVARTLQAGGLAALGAAIVAGGLQDEVS